MQPRWGWDESRFPPQGDRHAYALQVARGAARMAQQRVVLIGLARNLGSKIHSTALALESLGSHFLDYRIAIYENDSEDGTGGWLEQWRDRQERLVLIREALGDPKHPPKRSSHRGERMGYYRSQCQKLVRERWANWDAAILIDLDLDGLFSEEGVAHSFGAAQWDFVGSNGLIFRRNRWDANRVIQYDAWAFRPAGSWDAIPTGQVNTMVWQRGDPLVPVYSCFGGLGIYRMEAYCAGRYGGPDCEHVPFHRSLWEQGFRQIYLNPSQLVLYGRKVRRWDRWVHRIDHMLGRVGLPRPAWHFPPDLSDHRSIAATTGQAIASRAAG